MSQDTEHRSDAHQWISYDAQSQLKLTGMAEGNQNINKITNINCFTGIFASKCRQYIVNTAYCIMDRLAVKCATI